MPNNPEQQPNFGERLRGCTNRIKLFCGQIAVGTGGAVVGEYKGNTLLTVGGALVLGSGIIGIAKEAIQLSRLTTEAINTPEVLSSQPE